MDRRRMVFATVGAAAAVTPATRAVRAQTPIDTPSEAGELLELYLFNVVQQGYRGYIDALFDGSAVDLEAVWDFHEDELDRLAEAGEVPTSAVDALAAEGEFAFAHGTRNGVEVFYLVQAAHGQITRMQISAVGESVVFGS